MKPGGSTVSVAFGGVLKRGEHLITNVSKVRAGNGLQPGITQYVVIESSGLVAVAVMPSPVTQSATFSHTDIHVFIHYCSL